MRIYQSNTYTKDLNWQHFNNEPSVQDRKHVKDQQPCVSVFVVYLTIPIATRGTSPDITMVFHTWLYYRFIEIKSNLRRKKLHRMN